MGYATARHFDVTHSLPDLTLRLRYAPQAAQQVGELMRQEQACCAFLKFEIHKEPDAVTLTIKAPEEARATVEARPVHKSPSLLTVESWLATVVSTAAPTVPRTICFQPQG